MTLLNYMLSLIASMAPMWAYVLNYVFALAFLATVPEMIRSLWRR